MKLHLALAAVAAFSSIAVGAQAAEPVVAKLNAAVAERTKVIAGGSVFVCEGDSCVANVPTSRTIGSASCKELARNVGAVSSFGDSRRQLDATKLEACNKVAKS